MRGFSINEFKERLRKARFLMEKNNMEMLLITSQHNFRYFTGLDSNFWESPTRPWFLLLSIKNDPIAIIPSIGKVALQNTWIKNIKTWDSPNPNDEGISVLQNEILSVKSEKCSIGCEIGLESHLRMSVKDFNILKQNLSIHKFIDASFIIWELRKIKSSEEITKIKKIVSIASKSFDELHKIIKIGQTEIEICNFMKKRMLDLGADYTQYMSCSSGPGGYKQIISNPSEKKLIEGDVLVIDTGTTFDGYFCDFDRNFGFGKISKSTHIAYEILWKATEAGMKMAKPGNTCADISNAMSNILNKYKPVGNSVGRMGHGIGLQLTEPPSIMANDKTVLCENMVIALEPSIEYAPNTILVQEEDLLITKNGFERLTTRTPIEIPIIY